MRKTAIMTLAFLGCLLAAGCHKTCHCYGYDGSHTYYTTEEVESSGSTCANMAYFDGRPFYTLCEWDY